MLKAFKHPLNQDKKIDFVEQFNEKLLVKQDEENLQIVDVRPIVLIRLAMLIAGIVLHAIRILCDSGPWPYCPLNYPSPRRHRTHACLLPLLLVQVRNSRVTQVSKTSFMTPSAFIFLYENQLFLTFKGQGVAVWNFRGELVTKYVVARSCSGCNTRGYDRFGSDSTVECHCE